MKKYLTLAVFFLVFFYIFFQTIPSFSRNILINKIENTYKGVHSISAYFYQQEVLPGYSQKIFYKGYFFYESPDKLAWVYISPIKKREVLSGGALYVIDSALKRVTVINVSESNGGYPPNIIAVIGNLSRYFKVIRVTENPGKGIIEAELKPINLQRARVIYADFKEGSFKIASLKILTHQGQTIDFHYSRVEFNRHIKEKVFSVNFPSDYKIIKEGY